MLADLAVRAVMMLCVAGADAPELKAVDHGADPTGRGDSTEVMSRLHASGRRVYYSDGVYRFNGKTLDLSGGVRFESPDGVTIRSDASPAGIIQFDDSGNLVGLIHNHLEIDEVDLGGNLPVESGSLVPPPLLADNPKTRMDVLAHWYNDFGLESTRAAGGMMGWTGWYYWSWNFHDAAGDGYDPARHPMLGYYRGDDPAVLDWQCYWLRQYGVTGVIVYLPSGERSGALDGWEAPTHRNHWVYRLLNDVPNFGGLSYVLAGACPYVDATPENRAMVESEWLALVRDVYLRYPGFYAVDRGGERYPVIYVHEEQALRGVFDNYRGARQTATFYARVAGVFRKAGYGGVALFARHAISDETIDYDALEANGVLHFTAHYAADHSSGPTYEERVRNYAPPTDRRTIINTFTAKHSHTPHPSEWHCPGHTPALFGELMAKAVAHVEQHGMPPVITCYNVAEWAEGGPGLQPNMQDRFGYLEAVRDAVVLPDAPGR